MDTNDYYSREYRNERALERTREDFGDLQNELAGRETGRAYRFTSDEERERRTGRANAKQAEQTRLQLLLTQPNYAQDYSRIMEMLIEAEQRTQPAIDKTENDLHQNDQELDDIQSRASTLSDGARVYRDADGNVFKEDGEQVLPPESDSIVWRDDNPSHEDYLRNRERDIVLRDYLDRLRDYQINVYREGKHEALISKATFEKIQKRLEGGVYAPARKDLNKDFILRGAVACGCCGKPLRSSWSTGKTKRFAYYLCQTKGCEMYGKSIPRAEIEGEFETLLASLPPKESLFKVTVAMFRTYWNTKLERAAASITTIERDMRDAESQIRKLVDRIVDATNERVITALENRISELEKRKLILAEKAQNTAAPQPAFDEVLELSLRVLANPYKIWASGKFTLRRLVLKLVFPEPLHYTRHEGYRTPKTSLPFNVLGGNFDGFSAGLLDGAAGEN
ncbi:zinc ribbon domain-containing protein [Eilatimonas milleporae]|uniref:zinc ribbon domain-containing protein n=1 Tax=Eilatimonas milleporae TaxID=911205 RepID=UPI000EF96F96|nr:zinc ribbon domain-containing protein [Eilatimonas milleporae]